jgi:hypothetical protein
MDPRVDTKCLHATGQLVQPYRIELAQGVAVVPS